VKRIKYWVIVASKDHVKLGIRDGIVQANHGKDSPLKRMSNGDFIIFYSSKENIDKPDKCQQFTAIGKLNDDEIFQVQMTDDFSPYRRKIDFLPSKEVSILPLINELQFIQNKKSWGYPFRRGFFEINVHDFDLIASHMLKTLHKHDV
jgi:predicted RNA-binding protein